MTRLPIIARRAEKRVAARGDPVLRGAITGHVEGGELSLAWVAPLVGLQRSKRREERARKLEETRARKEQRAANRSSQNRRRLKLIASERSDLLS